jgi:hypothetical protein
MDPVLDSTALIVLVCVGAAVALLAFGSSV